MARIRILPVFLIVCLALAALALSGCGGDDNGSQGTNKTGVQYRARDVEPVCEPMAKQAIRDILKNVEKAVGEEVDTEDAEAAVWLEIGSEHLVSQAKVYLHAAGLDPEQASRVAVSSGEYLFYGLCSRLTTLFGSDEAEMKALETLGADRAGAMYKEMGERLEAAGGSPEAIRRASEETARHQVERIKAKAHAISGMPLDLASPEAQAILALAIDWNAYTAMALAVESGLPPEIAVDVAMDSALALSSPMLMTGALFWPMYAMHEPVTAGEAEVLADTAMMILDETYWRMREEGAESYADLCSKAQEAALVMAGEGEELLIEGGGDTCRVSVRFGEDTAERVWQRPE